MGWRKYDVTSFRYNTRAWETDGRTDERTEILYQCRASALHCAIKGRRERTGSQCFRCKFVECSTVDVQTSARCQLPPIQTNSSGTCTTCTSRVEETAPRWRWRASWELSKRRCRTPSSTSSLTLEQRTTTSRKTLWASFSTNRARRVDVLYLCFIHSCFVRPKRLFWAKKSRILTTFWVNIVQFSCLC